MLPAAPKGSQQTRRAEKLFEKSPPTVNRQKQDKPKLHLNLAGNWVSKKDNYGNGLNKYLRKKKDLPTKKGTVSDDRRNYQQRKK
jgi:hypothetical protein